MGSLAGSKNPFETTKAIKMKIDQKVAELQASKRAVDKEIKEIKMQLQKMIQGLAEHKENRQRTKNMLGVSLAVSLSSLTLGFRSNIANNPPGISWPIIVGVGSAVCSVFYLKYLLSSAKRQSKQELLKDLFLTLIMPTAVENPEGINLAVESGRYLSMSLPANMFAYLVDEDYRIDETPELTSSYMNWW